VAKDTTTVLAEAEIRELLARYCRGIDRCDADLIRSVYHEDSTDDHGLYKGNGYEFADFIVPLLREHYESTMHCIFQSIIDVEGERASAETYAMAYDIRRDADGNRVFEQVGCRYVDGLERRDGEWKILRRVVVMDLDTSVPAPPESGLGESRALFQPGRRDREDLAYTATLSPATVD